MSNGLNLKFKVLCDNFLEFERFFEITLGSLNLKRSDFETKKTCPLAITHKNLPVSFEVMVGFGRWGDNYWESDANKSNYIKENPDVLVSLETNNSKKLFAIEFCSALPAGNQAWQRFARGKEFSRNGVDYFFISHIGGVELGANRKELSIRYPNPIVNFASNKHNFESEFGFYINLIEETPGCPDQIVSNFKDCIGVEPLIEYIHSATLNQTITDEMLVYQKNLINCYIKTKKNLSDFETDALKGFFDTKHGQNVVNWKKKYSIEVTKETKEILHAASIASNSYFGKDLPFTLIRSDKKIPFSKELNNILCKDMQILFDEKDEMFFCAIAGFKPRGDDARPDRGLVPMVDSIAGKDSKIVTLVFGPALSSLEERLNNNHKEVCLKNGLWGSVFQYSDYVIATSRNFKRPVFLKGDRFNYRKSAKKFIFYDKNTKLVPNENDVDTGIHITMKDDLGLFESIFNPPGGDWSGVSFVNQKSDEEIRYLTLPRAPDQKENKRPDHIYQDIKNNLIMVIESKTNFSSLLKEEGVGEKMITWTKNLLKHNPQVKKTKGEKWNSQTDKTDRLCDTTFFQCGAIIYKEESKSSLVEMMDKCSLDLLFLYILKDNNWNIKIIPRNSCILIPECLESLDRLYA